MRKITELLRYAVEVGASDVHLVSGETPIFRQHGNLVQGGSETLHEPLLQEMLLEIIPDRLQASFAEEHEVDFTLEEEGLGRFRANAFVEKGRPSLALRLVQTNVPTFEELGLPPILADLALSNSGIVLASGPTGCGKSTSLARMVQHINENLNKRIITLEDPIEFLFRNKSSVILQREIGTDTESFSAALRSVFRQDPDIVMIGEMRDAASFRAALTMAETGHLVFSTLHTDTASQAINRILNFFPPEERDIVQLSLSDNMRAVVCQRLVRGVDSRLLPTVEILINTPLVRKLLSNNDLEKLSAAIETDRESGMRTFNQSLYQLVQDEKITEETAMGQSLNPGQLQMLLEGINLDEERRIIAD